MRWDLDTYRNSDYPCCVQKDNFRKHSVTSDEKLNMNSSKQDLEALSSQLRLDMEEVHGPLLGGQVLANALGHISVTALRQARYRGQVSVPLFNLPNRRGFYALTRDVADWLASARMTPVTTVEKERTMPTG
jgi:hypothetical protein